MANILEMATKVIATKHQWCNGETVTIWEQGSQQVWLCNRDGWLRLQVFVDAFNLMDRRYSKTLTVGLFSPTKGQWIVSSTLNETSYRIWAYEVRRMVQ